MLRSRLPYPPEYRQPILELVRAGRSSEELSKEFEPTAQTIRDWVAQQDRDAGRRLDGLTTQEREELRKLRRENRRLREEREILNCPTCEEGNSSLRDQRADREIRQSIRGAVHNYPSGHLHARP